MLDDALKSQLKSYLEKVVRPIEIHAAVDASAKSVEMAGLLTDIANLSDKITLVEEQDSSERTPSFALTSPGHDISLRFAGIPLGHTPVDAGDAKLFELDALAVKHAEHIVIRREQQAGRIGERGVVREPLGVGMAVGADDRQVFDELVKRPCDRPRIRIGGKKPIRIEFVHIGSIRAPLNGPANAGRGGRH